MDTTERDPAVAGQLSLLADENAARPQVEPQVESLTIPEPRHRVLARTRAQHGWTSVRDRLDRACPHSTCGARATEWCRRRSTGRRELGYLHDDRR